MEQTCSTHVNVYTTEQVTVSIQVVKVHNANVYNRQTCTAEQHPQSRFTHEGRGQ